MRIVDAARDDTCAYPADEIMTAGSTVIRTDQIDRRGAEAAKVIITGIGARMAYCQRHLGSAARVLRRTEASQ